MSNGNFVNEFIAKIYGRVTTSDLSLITEELALFLNEWNVDKKGTGLIQYGGLPDAYKVYMVAKKIGGRSDGTLGLYRLCLEDLLYVINKPIEQITTNDLRAYLYNLKRRKNISDRTLDQRRLIMNAFFQWCSDEGYLVRNPCASIPPIKFEEKPRQPYTDTEMELLRSACMTLREKVILEVLYATGCRISELSNLQVSDIDFNSREVALFGKGKKHRTSYINARAEVALKMYLDKRKGTSSFVVVREKYPYDQMTTCGIRTV